MVYICILILLDCAFFFPSPPKQTVKLPPPPPKKKINTPKPPKYHQNHPKNHQKKKDGLELSLNQVTGAQIPLGIEGILARLGGLFGRDFCSLGGSKTKDPGVYKKPNTVGVFSFHIFWGISLLGVLNESFLLLAARKLTFAWSKRSLAVTFGWKIWEGEASNL